MRKTIVAKIFLYSLLISVITLLAEPTYAFSAPEKETLYETFYQTTNKLIETYEDQLGYYANPFFLSNKDRADHIYQDLLHHEKTRDCEYSYFYKINSELTKNHSNFNLELIQEFLTEAQNAIQGSDATISAKQANLFALKMLLPYIPRATCNDKQKQDIIAEVNFKTLLFGQTVYDTITRANNLKPFYATEEAWFTEKATIVKSKSSDKYMKIYPQEGAQVIELFIPTGYVPGIPNESEATIEATKTGVYILHIKKELKELNIPLFKAQPAELSDYLKNIYTRPVGISITEIPVKTRAAIIDKFDPKIDHKPKEIAVAIATHLANDYTYSLRLFQKRDPIDALRAGAFKCSMASYIMVAILRDIYKIPCRIIVGYRAKKVNHGNEKNNYSFLVTLEESHAWVEVFIDDKWLYFDPTPTQGGVEEGYQEDFSDQGTEEDSTSIQNDKLEMLVNGEVLSSYIPPEPLVHVLTPEQRLETREKIQEKLRSFGGEYYNSEYLQNKKEDHGSVAVYV